MNQDQKTKKLVIRRTTILTLKTRTGIKTGDGTCENVCWDTTANPQTQCPEPPPPPPALHFKLKP